MKPFATNDFFLIFLVCHKLLFIMYSDTKIKTSMHNKCSGLRKSLVVVHVRILILDPKLDYCDTAKTL